jgi:hypothetical protein
MKLTLKTLLLAAAVVFFILALLIEESTTKLSLIGLALFAGAFLVEDAGIGGRRRRLVR